MENLEFEFIDRAISILKEGDSESAAQLVREESELNQAEARYFVSLLYQMSEA